MAVKTISSSDIYIGARDTCGNLAARFATSASRKIARNSFRAFASGVERAYRVDARKGSTMKAIAALVALGVLFGFIELSSSWRLRGWVNRAIWIVLLAVIGAWSASTLFDLGWI